jgi:hypothetical protein
MLIIVLDFLFLSVCLFLAHILRAIFSRYELADTEMHTRMGRELFSATVQQLRISKSSHMQGCLLCTKDNSMALRPQAEYTDRAAAAGNRT